VSSVTSLALGLLLALGLSLALGLALLGSLLGLHEAKAGPIVRVVTRTIPNVRIAFIIDPLSENQAP